MSDAHSQHDDSPHEGPIKTPKQLILAVFFSFLIPIVAIILLATYVTSDVRPAAGSDGLGAEAVAQRIRPVGQVVVRDVTDIASMKTGDQVFDGAVRRLPHTPVSAARRRSAMPLPGRPACRPATRRC